MARIPEDQIEQLKNEVSVERLVESSGVELKKSGKDRLGRCPFHEDGEPSLVVTPGKNLLLRASLLPYRLPNWHRTISARWKPFSHIGVIRFS